MKAGIITIPDFNNYGNRLQNYALQKVLESLSLETVSYVPYRPVFIKKLIKTILKPDRSITFSQNILKLKRLRNFMKFDRDFVNTEAVNSTVFPAELNRKCDCFIAGSDQIWNPLWYTDYSFLQFADDGKKIAYAASFGCDEIPVDKYNIYKEMISKFKYISVRELSGKRIVDEMTGQDSRIVLDPTLLLTKDEWSLVEKQPGKKKNQQRYVLTYFLGGTDSYRDRYIKEIASLNNLKVCQLNNMHEDDIYECGPEEFVYLIDNAGAVLTDSFHATVFSIIFHVPFWTFDRLGKGKGMGNRIDTLLSMTGLENRKAKDHISVGDLQVDFTFADEKINENRKSSIEFLRKAVEGVKNDFFV